MGLFELLKEDQKDNDDDDDEKDDLLLWHYLSLEIAFFIIFHVWITNQSVPPM